jgi:hypothetical protein
MRRSIRAIVSEEHETEGLEIPAKTWSSRR